MFKTTAVGANGDQVRLDIEIFAPAPPESVATLTEQRGFVFAFFCLDKK